MSRSTSNSHSSRVIQSYVQNTESSRAIAQVLNPDSIHIHNSIGGFGSSGSGSSHGRGFPPPSDYQNEDAEEEEFKNQVRIWMRLDNEIKELNKQIKMFNVEIKQRKKYIMSLTPMILSYMKRKDIEELNSKNGRLQYKTSMVKPPLSQRELKDTLYTRFPEHADQLDQIFKERDRIEKTSLRRLM